MNILLNIKWKNINYVQMEVIMFYGLSNFVLLSTNAQHRN